VRRRGQSAPYGSWSPSVTCSVLSVRSVMSPPLRLTHRVTACVSTCGAISVEGLARV